MNIPRVYLYPHATDAGRYWRWTLDPVAPEYATAPINRGVDYPHIEGAYEGAREAIGCFKAIYQPPPMESAR